jgi:hypothetical protein
MWITYHVYFIELETWLIKKEIKLEGSYEEQQEALRKLRESKNHG